MIEQSIAHLSEEIQSVIKQVIDPIKRQYQPLGIVLVGSYANGVPRNNSDLDIYIISQDQEWRERGNYIVDGVEIEYFINPVKQIRAYFVQEKSPHRHTANMLSTGIILYQNDPVVTELVEEAKKVFEDNPPLEGIELELSKYSTDDIQKDLIDSKENMDSLEYQLTASRGINNIIEIFYRVYQVNMLKPRNMMKQIKEIDKTFAELLEGTIKTNYEYKSFEKLIEYTETLLGGKRDLIWRLPGHLTINE